MKVLNVLAAIFTGGSVVMAVQKNLIIDTDLHSDVEYAHPVHLLGLKLTKGAAMQEH
jgi:hypothetical protein